MSRIGKKPIAIPSGVTVTSDNNIVTVKGKLGELKQALTPDISIVIVDNVLTVETVSTERFAGAMHGLTRALLANMVEGVSKGFSKTLDMVGVGYRANVKGNKLNVSAGFSHPVEVVAPEGVTFVVNNDTEIVISGYNKQVVGEVAANIRKIRKPEPYKGKGIKYHDEVIRRKQGKTAK